MAKRKHPHYRVRFTEEGIPTHYMSSSTFLSQREAIAYAHKHYPDATTLEIVIPFEVVKRLR